MRTSAWQASVLGWIAAAWLGCGGAPSDGDANDDGGDGGDADNDDDDAPPFGEVFSGDYHLGPVDFAETQWHNSCAPYAAEIQTLTGNLIAGVDQSLNGDGSLCDACARISARTGTEVVVRIVTTGVSNAPGDMDVSPEAFDVLGGTDPMGTAEHPRPMTWQLVPCPGDAAIQLQFQTGANEWWTSLWVRNPKLPVTEVAVRSANHAELTPLRRETDGTFNDDGGFGPGAFELRIVAQDGQEVTASFDGFTPGSLVDAGVQFE